MSNSQPVTEGIKTQQKNKRCFELAVVKPADDRCVSWQTGHRIVFDAFTDHGLSPLGGRQEIVSAGGDTTAQQEAQVTVVDLCVLYGLDIIDPLRPRIINNKVLPASVSAISIAI